MPAVRGQNGALLPIRKREIDHVNEVGFAIEIEGCIESFAVELDTAARKNIAMLGVFFDLKGRCPFTSKP